MRTIGRRADSTLSGESEGGPMAARGDRRRASSIEPGEFLEARLLLAVARSLSPAAEVQRLDRPAPPPKAPSLFMEPTAGRQPILGAIASARKQIRLGICNFDDPTIGDALIAAVQRGVRVRLILPLTPRNNSSNDAGIALLASNGVQVHVTIGQYPPAGSMPYMHAKTMIVERPARLPGVDRPPDRLDQRGPRAGDPPPRAALHRSVQPPAPVRLGGDDAAGIGLLDESARRTPRRHPESHVGGRPARDLPKRSRIPNRCTTRSSLTTAWMS